MPAAGANAPAPRSRARPPSGRDLRALAPHQKYVWVRSTVEGLMEQRGLAQAENYGWNDRAAPSGAEWNGRVQLVNRLSNGSAGAATPEKQEKRQGAYQNQPAIEGNLGEGQHARLHRDLSVENRQRLLLRSHRVYSPRYQTACQHRQPAQGLRIAYSDVLGQHR